jgi:hypothetical protein
MLLNIASTSESGRQEFGVEDFVNLDALPEGKFREYLIRVLDAQSEPTSTLVLDVETPADFPESQEQAFFSALATYIKYFTSTDPVVLSEEESYYLAVVGYEYGDLTPLRRLNRQFNELNDDHYWLYLADDELFTNVMDIEMVRRRTRPPSTLELVDLTEGSPQFQLGNLPGTIRGTYTKVFESDSTRLVRPKSFSVTSDWARVIEPGNEAQLNLVNPDPLALITMYQTDGADGELLGLIREITAAGGIIAGGFVNSLVYPSFNAVEIGRPNLVYPRGTLKYMESALPLANWVTDPVTFSLSRDDTSGVSLEIPGFWDLVELFHAQNPNIEDPEDPTEEELELIRAYDQLALRNVDLEGPLRANSSLLRVIDGKLYRIYYNRSPDVDIFFAGDNYLESYRNVSDFLMRHRTDLTSINHGEHVTTFEKLDCAKLKFQLIKRAYASPEEVVAGFDLNSSQVMLTSNANYLSIQSTTSYYYAVQLGINVMVPSRQSLTFNKRLRKYRDRGFQPYLVGNIQRQFNMFNGDERELREKCVIDTGAYSDTYVVQPNIYALFLQLTSTSSDYKDAFLNKYDYEYTEVEQETARRVRRKTKRLKTVIEEEEDLYSEAGEAYEDADYDNEEEEGDEEEEEEEEEEEDEEDENDNQKLRSLRVAHYNEERNRQILNYEIEPSVKDVYNLQQELDTSIHRLRVKLLHDKMIALRDGLPQLTQKAEETSVKLDRLTLRINVFTSSLFWNVTDPTTQFTGSFNPIKISYLSPNLDQTFLPPAPNEVPPLVSEAVGATFDALTLRDRVSSPEMADALRDIMASYASYSRDLYAKIMEQWEEVKSLDAEMNDYSMTKFGYGHYEDLEFNNDEFYLNRYNFYLKRQRPSVQLRRSSAAEVSPAAKSPVRATRRTSLPRSAGSESLTRRTRSSSVRSARSPSPAYSDRSRKSLSSQRTRSSSVRSARSPSPAYSDRSRKSLSSQRTRSSSVRSARSLSPVYSDRPLETLSPPRPRRLAVRSPIAPPSRVSRRVRKGEMPPPALSRQPRAGARIRAISPDGSSSF